MPYLSAYPRAGDIALLCEGDLVGYEATLFQKWTDAELGTNPLVDIWPCGTKGSIHGMSDAIGRSRPVLVVEDRDFRTPDEAKAECSGNKEDRERRDVRVIVWHAWRRCEIENYLLEPDVLLPVFRDAFGCQDGDVVAAANEILPALALFQAGQRAMHRARGAWSSTDPASMLLSGSSSRPRWNDARQAILPPDESAFRTKLEENSNIWGEKRRGLQCDVVEEFEVNLALWRNCDWNDTSWRVDWAGKEVLQWPRIAMTSRFGWPDPANPEQRAPLLWAMNRQRLDAQDRPIEAALRPRLVNSFLAKLSSSPGEIRNEFGQIKAALKEVPVCPRQEL